MTRRIALARWRRLQAEAEDDVRASAASFADARLQEMVNNGWDEDAAKVALRVWWRSPETQAQARRLIGEETRRLIDPRAPRALQ